MRELFRTLPLMCAVLLVPVLPFLFFGGQFDDWIQSIEDDPPSKAATMAAPSVPKSMNLMPSR